MRQVSAAPAEQLWGETQLGWGEVSAEEFHQVGMLYRLNSQHLWRYGLALTMTGWDTRARLAEQLKPRIRRALEAGAARGDYGPTVSAIDDAWVDRFFEVMAEDLSGRIDRGIVINEPDPIASITSALTAEEQRDRLNRSRSWLLARLREIEA